MMQNLINFFFLINIIYSYNIENSHAAKKFVSLSPVLDAKEHKEIKEIESGTDEL